VVVVEQPLSLAPWFFAQADTSHTPTKIAQNADWQLVWYEPIGRSQAAARLAGERTGRVPGLPSDLLVNGQSLADSVLPPVWGYFGPEWTDPAVDGGPRCTIERGSLYLFTPSPLEASVVLDPPRGGFGGTVQVAVNDGEPVAAERPRKRESAAERDRSGNAVQVPLSLAAGWNTLTIAVGDLDQSLTVVDEGERVDPCVAADPASPSLRIKTIDVRYGTT